MLDSVKELIVSQVGRTLIRKIMRVIGLLLIGINIPQPVVDQFVSSGTAVPVGVLTWLLSEGWSYLEKRLAKKAKLE